MIRTNIVNSVSEHDSIRYSSIQKQVFELFDVFQNCTITYEIGTNWLKVKINDVDIECQIKKKFVALRILCSNLFDIEVPLVKLGYNKDIFKKFERFCMVVRKCQELTYKIKTTPFDVNIKVIVEFLTKELCSDKLALTYFSNDPFNGIEINFFLHPKGSPPADGVLYCIENDTQELNPFWNASTPRRTKAYGEHEGIEGVFKFTNTDLASMKAKIEEIEKLDAKIKAFNPELSPELVKLLVFKQKANALLADLKQSCETNKRNSK